MIKDGIADVAVSATADVVSMVIKDGIADFSVAAGAVKVDCGIYDVKDEVSKLKFHLDLPSYCLSTNSTHSFGSILIVF